MNEIYIYIERERDIYREREINRANSCNLDRE